MKKRLLFFAAVAMAGTATAQTVTNAGFETWHTVSESGKTLDIANGWSCPDSIANSTLISAFLGGNTSRQLFKSTDMHSGTYAARIETHTQGSLGVLPGILSNANASVDLATTTYTFSGGTAVTQAIDTVSAWIKYIPSGVDTGGIMVQAIKSGAGAGGTDSTVGYGYLPVAATSTYTHMSVPVAYSSPLTPDMVRIFFSSSPFALTGGQDSSVMLVDDVTMHVLVPSAIPAVTAGTNVLKMFPNPAVNELQLVSNGNGPLVWSAYSINGQLVASKAFTGSTTISTANLAAAAYLYKLTGKDGALLQQGRFMVQH